MLELARLIGYELAPGVAASTEDPFATRDQRAAFEVEMCEASVSEWSLELYG